MKRILIAAVLLAFASPAMAQMGLTPQWDARKMELEADPAVAAMARRFQNAPWVDPDFHGYRTDHADSDSARLSPRNDPSLARKQ